MLDVVGSQRALLLGHSMGGIVAMATALAHPDRVAGLVLIGTASQCSERVAGWYERIAAAGERDGVEGLTRTIYGPDSRKQVIGDAQGIAHVTRTLKSLHEDSLTPRLDEKLGTGTYEAFPMGEIRGNLVLVPEPHRAWLGAAALLALAYVRRRRSSASTESAAAARTARVGSGSRRKT